MKRFFLTLLLVAVLSLLPIGGIFAAEDTVMVTATGEFIGFSIDNTSVALGTVAVSTSYWSHGDHETAPSGGTLLAADCHFTVTNDSTVITDVTINTADGTSTGTGWTCSDTATADANTFGMTAGVEGDVVPLTTIVKKSATFNFLEEDLAVETGFKWEFKLLTPTSMTDGEENTVTVTLTMVTAS